MLMENDIKVEIIQDEWFPMYTFEKIKPKYWSAKKAVLTKEELLFCEKAFKTFKVAQDLLEKKYNGD